MPVPVQCRCGILYNLKDEFAGKLLQCPSCGEHIRAPQPRPTSAGPFAKIFGHEKFLLRQKHFAIAEKYYIKDETGNDLLFVERPARLFARIGAFLLVVAAAIFLQVFTGFRIPAFFATVFLILALYAIKPKRNVSFYEDNSKQHCLLKLTQDKWFQLPEASFTLTDEQGNILGAFRKNQFTDFWRKRWRFYLPDGKLQLTAREDSIILSILRRITGLFIDFAIFRTNFVIFAGDSDQVLGEFNRKFTLLDRYLLDMSPDTDQIVDKRVAVALGVLLDTGEGR